MLSKQMQRLVERYPFTEQELAQLLRAHCSILDPRANESFLATLALSSPYSFFFLPGHEMRRRIELIEGKVLPKGFGSFLRAAISVEPIVDISNTNVDALFESFLEGLSDCGQRGIDEALGVIWRCCCYMNNFDDELSPRVLINLCYRLAIAAEILVSPNDVDIEALNDEVVACLPLERSLGRLGTNGAVTQNAFKNWAQTKVPLLSSVLSTFMSNLLFHGHHTDHQLHFTPFILPELDQPSSIFDENKKVSLFALACTSPKLMGVWHNLYSFEYHGNSMNRLQHAILGYDGPSLVVIETTEGHVLGACVSHKWKHSCEFHGNSDAFLFQLNPELDVFLPTGEGTNYCILNKAGMGFGGTKDKPRIFLPYDLEGCRACSIDKTFQSGNLIPNDSMGWPERFEIKSIEVWATGDEETVRKGLMAREESRRITESTINSIRTIKDKSVFVEDINLIDTKLYKHRDETRGRSDFSVDEKHGGYVVEPSQ